MQPITDNSPNPVESTPAARSAMAAKRGQRRGERGEGIISTAIAVLIIAALGVVAYGAFDGLFNTASTKAESQIESIGG